MASDYVAVDVSSPPTGNGSGFYLTGVAVEVSDSNAFNEYYFNFVNDYTDKYSVEVPYPVLKSSTIRNQIESYRMREAMNDVYMGILQNPHIERVHVCVGWYGESVDLPFEEGERGPMSFATSMLRNYFEIVTLWRYHRGHRYLPDTAFLDDCQGKITKAWKYVGNEFDINMVPHGDLTYPAISSADIIANYLSTLFPQEEGFETYEDMAAGRLIEERNSQVEPYVVAESVTEEYADHIVPTLRHTIQPELHYPHPILFVHDEVLSGGGGQILPETDFHAFARKWAFNEGGCVVNLQANRVPSMVRDGDRFVYTQGSDPAEAEIMKELHPTRDVEVLTTQELLADVL